MNRAVMLPVIIIAAVVLGGLLYLYGGPQFHPAPSQVQTSGTTLPPSGLHFTVLAEGQNAAGIQDRVNYRVTNAEQLGSLWQMIYTDNGQSVPTIDFDKYEVLAIFDGSHSTGGYSVQLADIHDKDGQRVVSLTHITPDDSCVPTSSVTSPYLIVQVQKSSLPISRVEKTSTTPCQ